MFCLVASPPSPISTATFGLTSHSVFCLQELSCQRLLNPQGKPTVMPSLSCFHLLSHRSRLAAFTAATDTAHQAAASQASTTAGSHQATAQHQTASKSGEASEAAAPGGSYSEAMEEAGEPGSPVHSKPQEFLAGLQPEQRHRLAVLVDTAILKVRCATQAYRKCVSDFYVALHGWLAFSSACLLKSITTCVARHQ